MAIHHLSMDSALGGHERLPKFRTPARGRWRRAGGWCGGSPRWWGSCGWTLTCCPSEVGFPGGVAAKSWPVASACMVRPP